MTEMAIEAEHFSDFGNALFFHRRAGYAAVKGKATGKQGEQIAVGRMGHVTMEADGEAAMAPPFTYNAGNVDKFAKIF